MKHHGTKFRSMGIAMILGCVAGSPALAQNAPGPQPTSGTPGQNPKQPAPTAAQPAAPAQPAPTGTTAQPAPGQAPQAPVTPPAPTGTPGTQTPAPSGTATPTTPPVQPTAPQPAPLPAGAPVATPAPQPAPESPAAPANPATTEGAGNSADAPEDTITEAELLEQMALEGTAEVIVVTGSRIRTDPLDKQSPVRQLSKEDLDRTGLTSVADILQRLPVSGGALNTKFNSSGNFGFPPDGGGIGAGSAQADLRYLGSKRVLVLVDGVRWVNGSAASGVPGATDLNTIPAAMIDRIEVLEDGASAVYGSDAIGGVINIITKKEWEGVRANVYAGGYQQGDGFTQNYDLAFGNKSERMSLTFGLSFVDQGQISSGDREISRTAVPGVEECTPGCSSATPQGRFIIVDPATGEEYNVTLNPGTGTPVWNPGGADHTYNDFDTADRFNFAPYNLMLTPSQRFGVYSGVDYKVAPRVTAFARAVFSNRQSTNQAAPEPLFIGPGSGSGGILDTIAIDVTNPYNPFDFTIDPATNPEYFIGRRPIEAGPRVFRQNVNTLYLSGGVRGDFDAANRRFYWDGTLAYGVNRADQIKRGFNAARLKKALGPLEDCMADERCVPFNIFGGQGANGEGTITKEMLDYVMFWQKDLSQQELFDATANISGDLFRLPAGPLSMAAGAEYRALEGFFEPDSVAVAGEGETPTTPTAGDYWVAEAYSELRLPLVSKQPGADLLDLTGAVRVSRYSTFGSQATVKAGARWRPIKDILVRSNWAQGFRAPGIGELFGSESGFDAVLDDPCSDMLGMNGGQRAPQEIIDNCIAQGVPADGSYQQINPQIQVLTGGNRALEPETSTSLTASLVYSPSWLEAQQRSWLADLELELTYYRIELDNAIKAIDAQVQLDTCVRENDDLLCQGIERGPGGIINRFANQLTNIGGLFTDGIDVTLSYTSPMTTAGRFRATSSSSILLSFTERIPSSSESGFDEIEREGTEVGDPVQAYPRFKSTLVLDWFKGEWAVSLTNRFINSVTEPCRDLNEFPGTCSNPNTMDDTLSTNVMDPALYTDAQVTWTPRKLDSRLDITLGINNLFNQDPPVCYSCSLNGFDASTYDVPGMFGYLKAGYRL